MEKSEVEILGEELDKLFTFQDKHLTKDKRSILIDALLESKIPMGAIVLGVRKLQQDDLNSIKLGTIFAAARSHVQGDDEQRRGCKDCASGMVLMKDEGGRVFSLACRCSYGSNVQRTHGLKKWGGQSSQMSNGRILYLLGTFEMKMA